MSSGSVKMSIESKPISFVIRIPYAVSRPVWAHAELMRPSFMGRLPVQWSESRLDANRRNAERRVGTRRLERGDLPPLCASTEDVYPRTESGDKSPHSQMLLLLTASGALRQALRPKPRGPPR